MWVACFFVIQFGQKYFKILSSLASFCFIPHSQIQSHRHTDEDMVGCVCVLDTLLSAGVHTSVWLAQLHPNI